MSSKSENAIGNTPGIHGFPEKCDCGRDVTIYVSKTQENPGRPFFRCPTKKEDHLFKWVEEGIYEEVVDILPRLGYIESKFDNSNSELVELKAITVELKEEVLKSRMEIQRSKKMMKFCVGFLCLITVVILVMIIGGKAKNLPHLANRV